MDHARRDRRRPRRGPRDQPGRVRDPAEADLVDALRADPAWIPGLSIVATDGSGALVAHALLTRCHIGRTCALCLAPCAVRPAHQRTGAGSAVIRAGLRAATERGERSVTVLGHPTYYPRFAFTRASEHGIGLDIDVPDEALMVLTLDRPIPTRRPDPLRGTVRHLTGAARAAAGHRQEPT